MHLGRRLMFLALVIAAAVALCSCAGGGSGARSSGTIVADESAVPDGMPVMYEFYTDS